MALTKEEERAFNRRLDAYVEARDAILGRWRADSTQYLARSSFEDVPKEQRLLYLEAYDFLQRHGAINFGAVQPVPRGPGDPEEKALSEQDIVLALYEILRTVDFQTATEKAIRKQLAEKLGMPMESYKRLINKHVNYVVEHLHERETLQPLGFEEGEEGWRAQEPQQSRRPQSVVVVGAGAAGLAAASSLQKCGVHVTILEARPALGGRCIAAHSCRAGADSGAGPKLLPTGGALLDAGGSGEDRAADGGLVAGSEGGAEPWYLEALTPLPLALRPNGVGDGDGGLGSRGAAVELLQVLGQQQGLAVAGDQSLSKGGALLVFDPATGAAVPLERLTASSQLLQELLLSCQFAAHQPSLRAAIDEELQMRLRKADQDIIAAAAAAEAAATATANAAAAVAQVDAACIDDDAAMAAVAAAAAAAATAGKEGAQAEGEGAAADNSAAAEAEGQQEEQEEAKKDHKQELQRLQQRQQQWQQQQEQQRMELQQREEQQRRAEEAVEEAHAAQRDLQVAARAMTWQLCAFEMYAGVSLGALPPPAANQLRAAVVPTGMAPGPPCAFASLFPVGTHPKPISLPASTAGTAGTADERVAAASLQGSVLQGLGHLNLDIRFGDPVVRIVYGQDGATVITQSGAEHVAGLAILAVPLGVLQAEAISLEPPLPLWKADAHARLGVTHAVCVALEYERAFWRAQQDGDASEGKLFGVLPELLPPPIPPTDDLGGEAAVAAATAAAAAAESGAGAAALGWVFEEVQAPAGEGRVVVLAHALAAPGIQAAKLPDSALQQAAAAALQSVAPAPAEADTGAAAEGGAGAEGDGGGEGAPAAASGEGEDGDADFSDFACFERMLAAVPGSGAKQRAAAAGQPPLRAAVCRWDGANLAAGGRACALPGARACGLLREDEDEGVLIAAAAAPLQEALLFAGEHTVQAGLMGTVPGALLSGVREAARAYKLQHQLRVDGEVADAEVLDEVVLDTGKLKADAKARDKERRQAVKLKLKEEARTAKAEKDKARKAAAATAKKRRKEQEDEDAQPGDEEETSDSESETDVEREVKKPRRKKGEGKRKAKRARSPTASGEEAGEEEEEAAKKPKKEKGTKKPSMRRKRSPSEQPEADMFLDPVRYEEQQARREELRFFLKTVHKAVINAAKANVQPIWEVIEAAETIESRSHLVNVLLHADQDAINYMGGDEPLLRILATWVQDLSQEASTQHLLLSLFKILERMPSGLATVRQSNLLAAVKKLRGNEARKDARAGANELWSVWEKRFKEHNRLASIAAAQAAAKASKAIDPLLGLDSIRQEQQQPLQPFGGLPLLPPQQQQQQAQPPQAPTPPEAVMEEAQPQSVLLEELDEEDRVRIEALEAKLAEDERLLMEAEALRREQEQQAAAADAPKLPRIPTFDEYAKKRLMKREKAKAKGKEAAAIRRGSRGPAGEGAEAPPTAPAAQPVGSAAAGTSRAAPTPLYNIVTKMLSAAVSKGELEKDRFKVMREKVITKVESGKAKEEVHGEAYVRQHMEKIKRLVKSYMETKQGKTKGGQAG